MQKNIYLTRQEQMIFNILSHADIIYIDEIRDFFPDLKSYQINNIYHNLSLKGYLHRLKKGVYMVQKKPSDLSIIKNPNNIGLALFKGYIGFASALRVYDLLDYEPFTIFVITKNRSIERIIGEYTFKSVAMGNKAIGMTYYKGIYISTIPKTFFDCFYKPYYGGGYSTILKALYDTDMDWDELISYFKFASCSLCQRTGYVLELLSSITDKIPNYVLPYFKKRIKNNTKLLPSGEVTGKYIKEWMVLDNLGEEKIMSWWYNG